MDAREADYGSAAIQELQLRHGEPDDVHIGRRVFQQSGFDTAVASDSVGVYGGVSRAGSLGERSRAGSGYAGCGAAYHEDSSEIPDCFWLALHGDRDAL